MRKYMPNRLHYSGRETSRKYNKDSELKAMLWATLKLTFRKTPVITKLDHSLFGTWMAPEKKLRLKVDIAVYYLDELVCLIEVAGTYRKWFTSRGTRRQYRYRSFGVPVFLVWRRSHIPRIRKAINHLIRTSMRAKRNGLGAALDAINQENIAKRAVIEQYEAFITASDTPKKPQRVIRTKLVDGDMRPNYTRLPRLDLTPSKVDPSTNGGSVYGKARYENLPVMDTPNRAKVRFNPPVPQRKTKRIGF